MGPFSPKNWLLSPSPSPLPPLLVSRSAKQASGDIKEQHCRCCWIKVQPSWQPEELQRRLQPPTPSRYRDAWIKQHKEINASMSKMCDISGKGEGIERHTKKGKQKGGEWGMQPPCWGESYLFLDAFVKRASSLCQNWESQLLHHVVGITWWGKWTRRWTGGGKLPSGTATQSR